MERAMMRNWLGSFDKEERYPIWIISYKRAGTAPFLNLIRDQWERQHDVNVLVRDSQRADYEAAYPRMTIRSLPDEQIGNCGSARWGAADMALSLGHEKVIMADDDVLRTRFLFKRALTRGPNKGKPCSGHSTQEDEDCLPDLCERVANGVTYVAEQVFAEHPDAVLGGAIKQHMSFDVRNQETQYVLNGGVTPRQFMVWHLGRLKEKGIRLNLDHFGVTGEDIGLAADVLRKGGDMFAMPSFVYEHWPESINIKTSTIRNVDNSARLHAYEWECLQKYPIKDYIRIRRNIIDGSYQWGDVNWQKLNKLRGTEMLRVPWDETQIQMDIDLAGTVALQSPADLLEDLI